MSRSSTIIDPSGAPRGNRMPPVHPGEVLREDVLRPAGLSGAALARALNLPARRVADVLHGRRPVTADMALRLSRYLGTSAQFWLNLQASYDLKTVERTHGRAIAREIRPRAA